MPSFHGKFVSNIFQLLVSLEKLPIFPCPVSLEAVCDASELVGYSRANCQCLCLGGWWLLQSCLFVLGCRVLLTYQNCLLLAKRMLQSYR